MYTWASPSFRHRTPTALGVRVGVNPNACYPAGSSRQCRNFLRIDARAARSHGRRSHRQWGLTLTAHTHRRIRPHTQAHTRTRAHTHRHTHMHTHTHTQVNLRFLTNPFLFMVIGLEPLDYVSTQLRLLCAGSSRQCRQLL